MTLGRSGAGKENENVYWSFTGHLARLRGIYLTPLMNHRLLLGTGLKTSSQREIYEVRWWDSQNRCSMFMCLGGAYTFLFTQVSVVVCYLCVCVILHSDIFVIHSTYCTVQMHSLQVILYQFWMQDLGYVHMFDTVHIVDMYFSACASFFPILFLRLYARLQTAFTLRSQCLPKGEKYNGG